MKPFPPFRAGARVLPALAALSAVLAAAPARSQDTTVAAPAAPVSVLTMRDLPLDAVLTLLERFTGRAVLRPMALPAVTITFDSNRPLTQEEAVVAIQSLLALNQIATVPLGDKFLKVVPYATVRGEAPEIILEALSERPPSGQVVAKLFRLTFLRTEEAQGLVAQILNPAGAIVLPFPRANALLITDTLSNLQRVEYLFSQVDRPAETSALQPWFFPAKNAKASDLLNQVRTLLNTPAMNNVLGSGTTFTADDRTNQIIVIADERQVAYFKELFERLDVPADPNTRFEVMPLNNADAKAVSDLIARLVDAQNRNDTEARRGPGAGQANPAAPGPQPPEGVPAAPTQVTVASNAAGTNAQFSKLLTIVPDERANALVVAGTSDDIRLIRQLVEKLDVVLPQVRIEVVIAEVTVTDSNGFGIQGLEIEYSGDRFGAASLSLAGASVEGDIQDQSLAAVIGSAGSKANVRILQRPVLVTTHNKEASLLVGEERPYVSNFLNSGTTTGGSDSLTGFNSQVQYKEANLQLTVTPLIGADGSIQMEVTQTVNTFGPEPANSLGPSLNTREATSFVSVADGEVVVLGGLRSTSRNRTRSRFGPIPILSDLLGSRTWRDDETELMVFIRPKVLRDLSATTPDALEQVRDRTYGPEVLRSLDREGAAEEPSKGPQRPTFHKRN